MHTVRMKLSSAVNRYKQADTDTHNTKYREVFLFYAKLYTNITKVACHLTSGN